MVVNNEASTMFANVYSSKAMGLEIRFIVILLLSKMFKMIVLHSLQLTLPCCSSLVT